MTLKIHNTWLTDFPAFLDAVAAALPESSAKKGAKSVQPLALALGVRDTQAHEWVITRKYAPSGPMAFRMLLWLASAKPGRIADCRPANTQQKASR